jgi:hypothetical protein
MAFYSSQLKQLHISDKRKHCINAHNKKTENILFFHFLLQHQLLNHNINLCHRQLKKISLLEAKNIKLPFPLELSNYNKKQQIHLQLVKKSQFA